MQTFLLTLAFLAGTIGQRGVVEVMLHEPEAPPVVRDNIDDIIDRLAQCESSGDPDAINPDDGGSVSFGLLQIKKDTFQYFNQRHKLLPDLEYDEIENVIMDPDIQRALVRKVLEEDMDNLDRWYNCRVKMKI